LVLDLDKYDKDEITKLIEELKAKLRFEEIKNEDNFEAKNTTRPIGVWVGLYIQGWKIDLWVMNKENASKELTKNRDLALKLKDIDKNELLSLKSKLVNNPDYHKKFSSVDLYNAYLDDGVRTESEFYEWLERNKH